MAAEYVEVWLAQTDSQHGPLFRRVNRWGHIGEAALNPRSIGKIVDSRHREAGLPRLSTHDYRRTFVEHAHLERGPGDRTADRRALLPRDHCPL